MIACAAAAYLSGIDTRRIVMIAFAVSGGLSAFGGVLLAGYASKAAQSMGDAYLLPATAAVLLGGTSILGGAARIWGPSPASSSSRCCNRSPPSCRCRKPAARSSTAGDRSHAPSTGARRQAVKAVRSGYAERPSAIRRPCGCPWVCRFGKTGLSLRGRLPNGAVCGQSCCLDMPACF